MCEDLTAFRTNCYRQANQKTIKYLETNKKQKLEYMEYIEFKQEDLAIAIRQEKGKHRKKKHLQRKQTTKYHTLSFASRTCPDSPNISYQILYLQDSYYLSIVSHWVTNIVIPKSLEEIETTEYAILQALNCNYCL